MSPSVKALTTLVLLSEKLDSEAKFSMSLDRLDRFPENQALAGNFHLQDGALSKVNMARNCEISYQDHVKGAESDLTGTISVNASGHYCCAVKKYHPTS